MKQYLVTVKTPKGESKIRVSAPSEDAAKWNVLIGYNVEEKDIIKVREATYYKKHFGK